jgi:hypothetical protein
MGGVVTKELAVAEAGAGGLGMVRDRGFVPSSGMCGTNFLIPFGPQIDQIADAASTSGIVEFSSGNPRPDLVKGCAQANGSPKAGRTRRTASSPQHFRQLNGVAGGM